MPVKTMADYKADADVQSQCDSLASGDPRPHEPLSKTWAALIKYTKEYGIDNDGMSNPNAACTEKFNIKKGGGGGCVVM